MNGTLGQPTPLMDEADPPASTSFQLYPGFWYTNGPLPSCAADSEPDGDVDGVDLSAYANALLGPAPVTLSLADFAASFGLEVCP